MCQFYNNTIISTPRGRTSHGQQKDKLTTFIIYRKQFKYTTSFVASSSSKKIMTWSYTLCFTWLQTLFKNANPSLLQILMTGIAQHCQNDNNGKKRANDYENSKVSRESLCLLVKYKFMSEKNESVSTIQIILVYVYDLDSRQKSSLNKFVIFFLLLQLSAQHFFIYWCDPSYSCSQFIIIIIITTKTKRFVLGVHPTSACTYRSGPEFPVLHMQFTKHLQHFHLTIPVEM